MGSRSSLDMVASKPRMSSIVPLTRKIRRGRDTRPRNELRTATAKPRVEAQPEPAADPVRLAVLAMQGLGRASMRACWTGTAVEVVVPDPAIAAIFRAALAETVKTRPTDRLIRIVVD